MWHNAYLTTADPEHATDLAEKIEDIHESQAEYLGLLVPALPRYQNELYKKHFISMCLHKI
jgi:hypothetical protein